MLAILNVTIPLRFNLDPKLKDLGGLSLSSTVDALGNLMGIFNPIPPQESGSKKPSLYVLVKQYDQDMMASEVNYENTFTVSEHWFSGDDKIEILKED
mmetsp:Transcript_9008/g.13778  ORF Transcript_9008/g.13778 Transcript_9008/m.13778 type:complete len:98 (-) Transcript_9008:70-363(-)